MPDMVRSERGNGLSGRWARPPRFGKPLPQIGRGLLVAALAALSVDCALTQEVSRTPRSAIEQLLLTQAVERSLADLTVPLPEGTTVMVEVSGLQTDRAHMHVSEEDASFAVIDSPSWDLAYVRDAASARLGELGYSIKKTEDDAPYLVRVKVESMGTNQGKTFFGLPPIQSVIIPFALPQITIYQEQDQLAHVRVHLDVYENHSGRFVRATPKYTGSAYYNQYVVFFFFSFRSTDLIDPP
ncbi:MAG: hypothetical protein Q8N04_07860 [Nitrospira sp.]|nr:hypothetical protein [Nitrospira sp.]